MAKKPAPKPVAKQKDNVGGRGKQREKKPSK